MLLGSAIVKRWYVFLSILVALVLVLVACSDDDGNPPIMGTNAPPVIGFVTVSGLNPQSNSTLRVPPQFEVVLNPVARGGKEIVRVELNVNGINLPSKTSPPWEFEIDFGAITTTGPAIISAVAVDSQGLRSDPATQQVVVDATPPVVTIVSPEEDETVSGPIEVDVTAVDTGAGVRSIEVFFDGVEVGEEVFDTADEQQTFAVTIPVDVGGSIISDGEHVITARALDGIGNIGVSAERTITTRNQGAPVEAPDVSLDATNFEPIGAPIAGCRSVTCFQGTINVPVNVEDDFGNAVVTLIVQSPLGTQSLGPIESFPYTFRVDTTSYPDNSELTLIAEGSAVGSTEVNRSEPVIITVFNDSRLPVTILQSAIEPAPQPIAGCSSTQCYRGTIRVPVAVQDDDGTAIVRLIVEGPLGTQFVGPISEFPYIFEFDSTIYPDNSQLTLTAERRETEGGDASLSSPVPITVFNSDQTPPTLTFVEPVDGSTVAGTIRIEVSATDIESGIRSISIRFEDEQIASQVFDSAEPTQTLIVRRQPVDSEGNVLQDADYEIEAIAENDVGETTEETIIISTQNVGSPPAPPDPPEVRVDDIEPSATNPQPTQCNPTLVNDNGQSIETTGCFAGTITVPVRADSESGNPQVRLLITSQLFGTFPADEVLTDPPFIFTIDTLDFQNNDSLALRAEITDLDTGLSSLSDPVYITVFNRATPPRLVINSPSPAANPPTDGGDDGDDGDDVVGDVGDDGDDGGSDVLADTLVSGDLIVTVSVSSLTGSGYTLDLDGDGRVEAGDGIVVDQVDADSQPIQATLREGVIVELIDFTNEVVSERRLDFLAGVQPTTSGTYTTPNAINTVLLANDVYTLRVTVHARFNETNEPITLVRSLAIQTQNQSVNAPALQILSPTDRNGTAIPTIRDPDNAYIIVQATDDTEGIQFYELRIFSGIPNDDNTPSREFVGFQTPLPLNPPPQAIGINYNSEPFLPDSDTISDDHSYIIRITSEDGAGNRSFLDIRARIDRDPDVGVNLTTPSTTLFVESGQTAIINLDTLPFGDITLPPGTNYNYLTNGVRGLEPILNDSGVSSPSVGVARGAGAYQFVVQAITPDGNIYTSNFLLVQVVEVDESEEEPDNQAPRPTQEAQDVTVGTTETIEVNEIATDPEGEILQIIEVSSDPALGQAVRINSSSIEYTAPASGTGTDAFTALVSDGELEAEIEVTVNVVAAPPVEDEN
jgi:hypothetical protein